MSRSEAKELRERVTELERRLAAAEARIAMLEARPVAILPPVFGPAPVPPQSVIWITATDGGCDENVCTTTWPELRN